MTVVERAPGVYEVPSLLAGTIRVAQWFLSTPEGLVVVDAGVAGSFADVVAPALAALGRHPEDVTTLVLSHCDVDHAGGAAELLASAPRAVAIAHAEEARLLASWPALRAGRYAWIEEHGLAFPGETWAWLEQAAGEPVAIDAAHRPAGVELVPLPGHSPGLLGVWHPETRTLVAMDAIFGDGPDPADPERVTPPQYGSVAAYRATIARIGELAPTLLGSSHYEPLTADAISGFLDASERFVAELDDVVLAALGPAERPLRDILAAADATLGPFRPDFFELARSVHAHLEDAVERGLAAVEHHDAIPHWRTR